MTASALQSDAQSPSRMAGIVAYTALFAIGLPLALLVWMRQLDALLTLPHYDPSMAGVVLAATGIIIMLWAIMSLWKFGRGLPMSPFPPERLVVRGLYGLVADPIYLGAIATCLGASLALGSGSGTWIVTPVLALAAAAFVWGYERDATAKLFGPLPAPWLRLPAASDDRPHVRDWVSFWLLVLLPWLVAYEGISRLARDVPAWSTYLPGEYQWPIVPWTEMIYAATYALVVIVPLVARRQRDLRRLALRGLGATVAIGLFYLLVPLVAPYKPAGDDSLWSPLLRLERLSDQRACSLPSFHVLWACLVGDVIVAARPRLRWFAMALSLAIGASCVTTGMHSVLDVIAGYAAYGVVTRGGRLWQSLCGQAERIANSWREWPIGPIRIINHGVYAAVGAAAGVCVATCLAGSHQMWWIVGLTVGAELGAGIWAQLVEGSPRLLRPSGYFGGVIAAILMACIAGATGQNAWLLLGAMSVGGCVTQMLGRLRCLVQGCCHGRPIDTTWGISYSHPRSRVVRLSSLGGVRLHPTQLYSVLWMLGVFFVLLRLWTLGVPVPFVGGSYLVLAGIGRFVEEHYRGEPQTAEIKGLRLYQWLALAFVIGGAAVTTIGGTITPRPEFPAPLIWPLLAGVFAITYVVFGVDLPRSNRRFSRLV